MRESWSSPDCSLNPGGGGPPSGGFVLRSGLSFKLERTRGAGAPKAGQTVLQYGEKSKLEYFKRPLSR